jgi:hypothetical protein
VTAKGRFFYATNAKAGRAWGRPGEVMDVQKEFGAKFDGRADDTAALTSALTAAATGCVVQMPAGGAQLKKLEAPLVVPPGVTFRGVGAGQTVLNATNLDGYSGGTIVSVAGGGSYASDFAISYDFSGGTSAPDALTVEDDYPYAAGYPYLGGTFTTVERVLAFNISGNGFTVNGIEVRLVNCYAYTRAIFSDAGGYGFYVPQTDNMLIGCTADHAGNDGFHIDGANTKVVSCKAFGSKGHGFTLGGAGRHMVTGCEAQDNNRDGFHCVDSAPDNQLAGCLADTNGLDGRHPFRLLPVWEQRRRRVRRDQPERQTAELRVLRLRKGCALPDRERLLVEAARRR